MKIGYIRISTLDQNTARQEVLMEALEVDEIYIDRMSGKSADRPELRRMLEYVRRGDTVVVESISRFARNTRDLLELVERLTEKGVEFVSQKEAIDTTTPTGKFMLTVGPWPSWSGSISSSGSGRVLPLPGYRGNTRGESPSRPRILMRWSPAGGKETSQQ